MCFERFIGSGWEVFEGRRFYMQGLVFENPIYLWSLDPEARAGTGARPPALNVFIP